MRVSSSPQEIIRRKTAGPEYLSYEPQAIWQEVLDNERAIIERVNEALASGAMLDEGPQATLFARNFRMAFVEII